MTYGFRAINDSSRVQVDSMTPTLCLLAKGTYAASGTSKVTVSFPSPITSQIPPLIFLHPTEPTTQAWDLRTYIQVALIGSPGNWTGFRLETYNVNGRPQGKWFVASSDVSPAADYGMRLWDGNAKLLFDSDKPSVLFTRALWPWTYAGTLGSSAVPYWLAGSNNALTADEYLLLNPFAMDDLGFNTSGAMWGVCVDYGPNRVFLIDWGRGGYSVVGHKPLVYAKLTAT